MFTLGSKPDKSRTTTSESEQQINIHAPPVPQAVFRRRDIGWPVLRQIIDAGMPGVNAAGVSPFEITLVKSDTSRSRLCQVLQQRGFLADPAVLLVFTCRTRRSRSYHGERSFRHLARQEVSVSVAYMQKCAFRHGIDAVYVSDFSDTEVSRVLGLDVDCLPVAILGLGEIEAPFPS